MMVGCTNDRFEWLNLDATWGAARRGQRRDQGCDLNAPGAAEAHAEHRNRF